MKAQKSIDLTKILEKYEGKWIALKPFTNKVIVSGERPGEVTTKAKEKGVENPVILKAKPVKHAFAG